MIKYLLFLLIFLYIWSFLIEPNIITVKKYKSDKFSNTKIVFISDLHIAKNDKKRLQKIVKLVNKQNPDVVISGGDYIKGHNGRTTMDIESIAKELSGINAPIYSVLGNHDGWFDKYTVKKNLEKYGVTVLSNSNTKFNNITIAGVEDLQTGYPDIETTLIGADTPVILVSHTPDIYYDVTSKVDLILAGHVHGGQVRIPFKGALIVPSKFGKRFACGDYNETGNRMIVTKGLGTSILNIRFNTIPEIVVIE